jgi:hypothetical protein
MKALALAALSVSVLVPAARAVTLQSAWTRAAEETEAARTLRVARSASDKAYRLNSDVAMLSRSVAETKAEAAALPARLERVEFLLKFVMDAYPVQGDAASYLLDKVLWLKYELGKPAHPELPAAVKELVGRIRASDDATQALKADVDALAAAVAASPAAGEKAKWLAERLAEQAAAQAKYSSYLREKTSVLEKPAP